MSGAFRVARARERGAVRLFGENFMTTEEIEKLLTLDAEFLESWRADADYFESEDWRDLSALLEREKKLEKDLPAFDVPDGFQLAEMMFSGLETALQKQYESSIKAQVERSGERWCKGLAKVG